MTDTPRDDDGTPTDRRSVTEPTDLKFVGPATAGVVTEAEFDAVDIADKRVSYGTLVGAGVNPGVTATLRRWHSLSWSFDSGSGLARRSEQVRGLQDGERAWVAASSGDCADDAASEDADSAAVRTDEWTPGDGPAARSSSGEREEATGGDWTPGDWGEAGASGAASDDVWGDATADGSGDESAWRERSVPTR